MKQENSKKELDVNNMRNQHMMFTCPLPPSVNEYLGKRVAYNPITKRPFVQVYETNKARAFKKHMSKVLERSINEFNWEKTDKHEYVTCQLNIFSNQKRKDADNMFKCLLDSLTENEIVYDDSTVLPSVKNLYIDKNNPRIEVFIAMSEKVGVFTDINAHDEFVRSYCSGCTRYARNCSLLKDCVENRIRSEIHCDNDKKYHCTCFKKKKVNRE